MFRSPLPTEHPVAGDPAAVVLARQPPGPAPRAGDRLQHAELGRRRAGQEAAGVRDPGDPLGDRQGGGQPQEAAVHRSSTHVPGERHGPGHHQALYLLSGSATLPEGLQLWTVFCIFRMETLF